MNSPVAYSAQESQAFSISWPGFAACLCHCPTVFCSVSICILMLTLTSVSLNSAPEVVSVKAVLLTGTKAADQPCYKNKGKASLVLLIHVD